MFKTLGSILRTLRAVALPVSRVVVAALLWSNRHTVATWARSLGREVYAQGVDVVRISRLVRALWTVTGHPAVANSPALRSIRLGTDGFVVETRAGWFGRGIAEELLAPMPPYPIEMTAA
jgi:hypothetical protein